MEKVEQEIISGFKQIQENVMRDWIYGDNNSGYFNWKNHFEKDKEAMNQIIDKIDNEIINGNEVFWDSNIGIIRPDQRMFHVLGYIPRDSEFTYPMNCFLYWYIKKHCPNAHIEVAEDGSIYGSVKNKLNNNNVCLNAHMDIINVNRQNRDRIFYGAFGKECKYKYEKGKGKEQHKLFLNRENPKSPLGADDGKGIATILNILKEYDENSMPNLTFFLSSVEENDLYSIRHFLDKKENIEKLFPKDLNNIAFLNFDAFEGKEIDLYSDQDLRTKPLEKEIIKMHNMYVKNELHEQPTQEQAWTNPMSDAYYLKTWITRMISKKKLPANYKMPLFISLNSTSSKPHSTKETIDINEFHKFQWYVRFLLLPPLSVYKFKDLTKQEIQTQNKKEIDNKIKKLQKQMNELKEHKKKVLEDKENQKEEPIKSL